MKYIVGMDVGCLLITLIIIFAYFSKRRLKTFETTFYAILLIVTFLGYFVEIAMFLSCMFYDGPLLTVIVDTYLSYMILEGVLFLLYNIIKYLEFKYDNKIEIINKRLYLTILVLSVILVGFVLATFLVPCKIVYYGEWAYGSGISIIFIVFILAFAFTVLSLVFLKFKKKMTSKDKSFFIFTLIIGIILSLLRIFTPYIAVTNIFLSTVTLVMFFTIENPDVEVINEMKRLNSVKSNFLSSMSHELKTPLNAIVGLSSFPSDDIETLKSDIQTINQESLLLLDMFTNIININLVDANNIAMNKIEYNVAAEFKTIFESFSTRFAAKGLTLNFNVSENVPVTLYGDFEKIKDITNNLVSNALKFTDNGYTDLNVSFEIKQNIPYLKVEVRDTGKGIADEDFKVLFSEFGKGKNEVNSNISGLGIGLSLCKILADSLGGKISLGSAVGIGSSFVLEVPQEMKKMSE